jgi:hypothetical protein
MPELALQRSSKQVLIDLPPHITSAFDIESDTLQLLLQHKLELAFGWHVLVM